MSGYYNIGDRGEFSLHRTKRGLPALWESGGGLSNTGRAMLIAGPDGSPKRAIYIPRRGSLACGEHALIVVEPGDIIVTANHHRLDFVIKVWRITGFQKDEKRDIAEAVLEMLFEEGEWVPEEPQGTLAEMVAAAKKKASSYHCRMPYWIIEE